MEPTRIQVEAAAIRKNADAKIISDIASQWPEVEAIQGRERFDASFEFSKLSNNLMKRIVGIEALIASAQSSLIWDIDRYTELKVDGLEAMSDYDLTIAHGGNGYAALRMAFYLKRNHISYQRGLIAACAAELARIEGEKFAALPQLALF